MGSGFSRKDIRRVLDAAEDQGCRLVTTRDGVLIHHWDGVSTIMLHWTVSDWRAWRNTRAEFRRLGLCWPFDGTTRPGREVVDENGGSRARMDT